ncbi:hypothetical protein DH2020_033485 [Rehmannia glutinosa]|uniref:ABC-2 type transporter transmembrane domain-containing protein n=1 Tax=Rehmannia glutinosa TaxID=99300 RepID=A0ABR0VD03_REHGL
MVDVEAQNQEDIDGEITPAAAIFKKANLPVTLKVHVSFITRRENPKPPKIPRKTNPKRHLLHGPPRRNARAIFGALRAKTTLLTASATLAADISPQDHNLQHKTILQRHETQHRRHPRRHPLPPPTATETLVYTALLRRPQKFNQTRKDPTRRGRYKSIRIVQCVKTKIIGNQFVLWEGSSALEFFESVGFVKSLAMNPADFLLDLANGVATADSHEDQAAIKQALVSAYKAHLSESVKSELANDNELQVSTDDKRLKRWSNTWWDQFSVLFRRGIKERKHESFSTLKIAQVLVVAILSGLLWWQSDISHLQDQVGLFFFCSGFWGFYPLFQAIFTFPQERMMLAKERSSGMYRLSSYFMALTLGDLPMELVLPTIFFTIAYWMAGLKPTPGSFFAGLFVLLYSVLCSQGLGLAIGAAVMDQKSATVLGSVIMLTFLLCSGYYVQHVPRFVSWIKYVSISQYTFKLLLGTQYKPGETYPCDSDKACLVEDFPSVKPVGLGGHAVCVIALGIMIVGYRLIAYLALMRIGVTRK